MDKLVAARIAKRFITLPLDKRKVYLEKMLAEGVSPANLPIPPVREAFAALPLSFAQQRQWFLWTLDPHSTAYHIPTTLRLRGALDVASLERSFNALIARHDTLRTCFEHVDGEVRQVVQAHATLRLEVETAQRQGQDLQAVIRAFVERETAQPFDLDHGPLLRVRLLALGEQDHVLALTQHHIVSDGWSMQVMVRELVELYGHFSQGSELQLPELPIQYADYAIWQRHWMEAGEQERQLAYWRAHLGTEHPVLALPLDQPRPAQQSFRGERLQVALRPGLFQGLQALAQRHNVTLFMLLLASYQVLLHRHTGQARIRVGVPTANRNRVETERLIGFFVNTQILQADVHGEQPFTALLQQVKQHALDAQAHQDLPFEQLVEALQPERNLSHNPLFQVLFNHQGNARPARVASNGGSGLDVESLQWDNGTAQLDLALDTFESADGLSASLTYATDLFARTTVERLAAHWQNLLQAIVADPSQRVGELPMLDAAEQQLIVEQWNATAIDHYPLDSAVHTLIEAQAAKTPDAVALVFGDAQLSYRELDQQANQLAHQLIEQGVGPDVLVGIAVERSLEMVLGLLAVLKAGGAYVPLDPEYPRDRLAYMFEDSGIELLLSQSHLQLPVPAAVRTLNLDLHGHLGYSSAPTGVLPAPENLAYVIYTSGSTGKPKGAGNRHKALTNRLCWM
ncbi:condensation domain-containing protein, partial [Pseudomonas sp. NPDC089752]|uniref:condensation domain-containing protein n=1 Tax=Pseudomonas sp. NPDC089752 TaxID=3364472 RepID=UPI003817CE38